MILLVGPCDNVSKQWDLIAHASNDEESSTHNDKRSDHDLVHDRVAVCAKERGRDGRRTNQSDPIDTHEIMDQRAKERAQK